MRRSAILTLAAVLCAGALVSAGNAPAQTQARPKPVAPPVKSTAPAPAPPQQPPQDPAQPTTATTTATSAGPSEATLGVPFFPGMQFIESYNAGSGQRYFIFGTASGFADVVAYYRSALKQKGELVFDVPATHEFDIGRFNEETMAFPPSVTVKDFTALGLPGYPNHHAGGEPARYRTIVQIVPIPAAPAAPIRR